MRVCVVLEHRFSQTADGAVWTEGAFPRGFWNRYLSDFDCVQVVARVRRVFEPPPRSERTDGEKVEFSPVPCFVGPWQYFLQAPAVWRAARRAIGPNDAVVLRVPSHLAGMIVPRLRREDRPYAVEVLGDPYEVFAPGGVQHPLRPFFRWSFSRNLRRHCQQACAVAYVTAQTLQRRYPPAPRAFRTWYSDVQLHGFVVEGPRRIQKKTSWRLVTVGSLAQLYKGTDTLIEAVACCTHAGLDLELVVVGDGQYRSQLQQQAATAGLADRVHFRGQLPAGQAVRDELNRADLFVLPSRTEGLPRVLIEAMACALPCLGSNVGGIPELLPAEDMVPASDPQALATRIQETLAEPRRMEQMSRRNLKRANDYQEDILAQRRSEFYRYLREATAVWLTQRDLHPRRSVSAFGHRRPDATVVASAHHPMGSTKE